MAAETDKLLGTILDERYLVESRLGSGGMGIVYRGRHVVIEKPVAIKFLRREVTRNPEILKRFVQEARAASRIRHPNIVDVTDFGTTADGLAYSVMELVDGPTLLAILHEQGRLPMWRAMTIAEQLARALAIGHEKGVVHRDLKPENVFLIHADGKDDFVKICDFGIAKVVAPGVTKITKAGAIMGTPEYMAPEQAAGRPDIDHRVDIYALGVVLYQMLAGRVPHKGETPVRTLGMQMMDAAVPPTQVCPEANIPPDLEQVIMKALAKRADDRYGSMGEFADALVAAGGAIPEWQPYGTTSRAYRVAESEPQASADADTVKEPLAAALARPLPGAEPATPAAVAGAPHGKRNRSQVFIIAALAVTVLVAGVAVAKTLLTSSDTSDQAALPADAAQIVPTPAAADDKPTPELVPADAALAPADAAPVPSSEQNRPRQERKDPRPKDPKRKDPKPEKEQPSSRCVEGLKNPFAECP